MGAWVWEGRQQEAGAGRGCGDWTAYKEGLPNGRLKQGQARRPEVGRARLMLWQMFGHRSRTPRRRVDANECRVGVRVRAVLRVCGLTRASCRLVVGRGLPTGAPQVVSKRN